MDREPLSCLAHTPNHWRGLRASGVRLARSDDPRSNRDICGIRSARWHQHGVARSHINSDRGRWPRTPWPAASRSSCSVFASGRTDSSTRGGRLRKSRSSKETLERLRRSIAISIHRERVPYTCCRLGLETCLKTLSVFSGIRSAYTLLRSAEISTRRPRWLGPCVSKRLFSV